MAKQGQPNTEAVKLVAERVGLDPATARAAVEAYEAWRRRKHADLMRSRRQRQDDAMAS